MVDFASPETFGTFGAKYIYLYTQQDARTYTFIYKETNRTAHMVHVHVLSCFTKIKNSPIDSPPNQKPPACY